jgi:hypothetical protein
MSIRRQKITPDMSLVGLWDMMSADTPAPPVSETFDIPS